MNRADSEFWSAGHTREWWKALDLAPRQEFLATMTRDLKERFFHDWRVWARDNQLPPDDDEFGWDTWLMLCGRGFGKTRTAVEFILDAVNTGWARRIAIVGQGVDDVRNVMVNGESGFVQCSPPWNKPTFYPSVGGGQLVWPNGCVAFIYSIADTEALRGPQFHIGWCDEPMAANRAQRERALDNLEFCLRLKGPNGESPRLLITTTPKPDPWLRKMEKQAKDPENRIWITRGATDENADNLAPSFLKKIHRKYDGTRIGKQEILGLILTDEEGALWTEEGLQRERLTPEKAAKLGGGNGCPTDPHELADWCDKVVVSVDPNTKGGETTAAKSKKIAHAAGIIVVGAKGRERFVIADRTVGGGPSKWGKAAVRAAEEFNADEIHAESNQGGDMVKMVVTQAMNELNFVVHVHLGFAKASKVGRAEPVATVYDRGEVHHAAYFEDLETQMLYLHEGEDPTGEDFDRCDALVWGLTRLGLKKRATRSSGSGSVGITTFEGILNGAAQQRAIPGFEGDWGGSDF